MLCMNLHPFDVKELRVKVGMFQNAFTSTFDMSVNILRHWQPGDSKPHGPALALLNVVAKELQTVLQTCVP